MEVKGLTAEDQSKSKMCKCSDFSTDIRGRKKKEKRIKHTHTSHKRCWILSEVWPTWDPAKSSPIPGLLSLK